ncbi:MAG TPA: FAD-dependent oxidoreductase, partial [Pyrinomonadaceae bacterium]|nr:FAD-dependent oxidoreductase [Pyrinomonadaceae bacterium]
MGTQARIVILGGGFGGLFTALELSGSAEVTLVSSGPQFEFKPLLYEYLSGEVEEWHIAPTYRELLDDSVRFIQGDATEIDFETQQVVLNAGQTYAFDVLVLAVGGVTNYAGVEGAEQYALPFRSLADADRLRARMVQALDAVPPDLSPQEARNALSFAVVGAGASGVELSTKMADLLNDAVSRRALPGEPRVMVIEMGDRV